MSGVSRSLGRRDFLGACACVVCSVVAGACASLVTRQLAPVDGKIELALTQYPELSEAGGALKIMPAGAVDPLYVLALDDGSYSALSPICTHLGCTVEIEGPRLVCPCHGSAYDRAGTVLQGPAALPLARYRTNLSPDGVLTIDLRSRA
jgi:Rieske Fe-S protein